MKVILAKIFGARQKLSRQRGKDDAEMPFLEHLEELRQMLVKIIGTLIVVTIASFVFREQLMDFIKKPVELAGLGATIELPAEIDKLEWRKVQTMAKTAQGLDPAIREAFLGAALTEEDNGLRPFIEALPIFNATLVLDEKTRETFVNDAIKDNPGLRDTVLKMVKLNPKAKVDRQGNMIEMSALRISEAFTLSLKISLIAGIVIAFPLLLYFLAQFIFPGLTAKEKRAILPAVGVGFLLFLGGASFAYWFVTPRVLEFMHGYAESLDVASDWRIGYYVSFVSQLVVIFGLSFELPVVVLTLVKLELLSYEYMARTRAYAVIIIFTVAAIITPTPDAFTLTLLAGPMVFLYEISIWMAFFIDRKRKRLEAEEEAERAVAREKRAKAHEVALPSTLPLGTVGHTPTNDESASQAYADNDAMQEDDDAEPEYEEGFEPKADDAEDDDDVSPYSNYEFHNHHYKDSDNDSPDEDISDDREKRDSVDDQPTSDNKEKDDKTRPDGDNDDDSSDSKLS
jgi:sec-independent protein translocase protein TatC